MATPSKVQEEQSPASRMTLSALVRGRQSKPLRVLLYGVEGIGKSTFGASAPAPVFVGAEDGTAHLDVTRFPAPENYGDVLAAIHTLTDDKHAFKTVVVDTIDWLEPLIWHHVCVEGGKTNIEDFGFGKGYVAALDTWRQFLSALERLRAQRNMHVILLGHSWIKLFKNPEGDDFDRHELKVHAKAGGLLKEWVDAVLFANYETLANKDERTKRIRGVSSGARFIYTARTAAYDAKNRFDLPEVLPLDWNDFSAAVEKHQPADPKTLTDEITRIAKGLPEALAEKATGAIGRANGDAQKLSQLLNWTKAQAMKTGKDGE